MAAASATSIWVSLAVVFVVMSLKTEAREHLVGGKEDAWKVPSSESESLNKWAGRSRFQIGDYLVWKYSSKKDSVLEVTRDAYLTCNSTAPVAAHTGGAARVLLDRSGPYYFVSGVEANCEKGEKLIVVVMAARNRQSGISPAMAPAPVTAEMEGPAVAPTSSATGLTGGSVVVGLGAWLGFMMM